MDKTNFIAKVDDLSKDLVQEVKESDGKKAIVIIACDDSLGDYCEKIGLNNSISVLAGRKDMLAKGVEDLLTNEKIQALIKQSLMHHILNNILNDDE